LFKEVCFCCTGCTVGIVWCIFGGVYLLLKGFLFVSVWLRGRRLGIDDSRIFSTWDVGVAVAVVC